MEKTSVECRVVTFAFEASLQGMMSIRSMEMEEPDGRIKLETGGVGECFVTMDSLQDLESLEVGQVLTCLDLMKRFGLEVEVEDLSLD